jgi:predicted AlkP superfamily phosphohydrolase/phosphomutase
MLHLRCGRVLAATLLFAACTPTGPAAPGGAETKAARVVLISFDGLGGVMHGRMLRRGVYRDPDGLAAFEGGFTVERAIPVNPTMTAVSHTSIATGAFPSLTGIAGNSFHNSGAPLTESVSGFSAPIAVETLWQAVRRQGKRVGVLAFPGCDGNGPARTADFGMTYVNTPFARAENVRLETKDFATVTLPKVAVSFAPGRRAVITVNLKGDGVPESTPFFLTALDTRDDGFTSYDTLVVDDDDDVSNGALATVRVGEWFPLSLHTPHPDGGTRTVGAWCLLQALAPDLSVVKFYRGAFFAAEAYPRPFREALEAGAGFWPGPGDDAALERTLARQDGLQLADVMEQTRRFSEYFTATARVACAREKFQLLMLYQPEVDEIEHMMLLTDPRQPNYSEGLRATADAAVASVHSIADHALGELARSLDLKHDALVVVSDHGMAPAWEDVHINQLLLRAGLVRTEQVDGTWRVAASSPMLAHASGGSANIYVNLQGREENGVVPPAGKAELVQQAASLLARFQVDGHDAVEGMFRHEQLAEIGLDTPNAGDLVVFMSLGFNATSSVGPREMPAHEPASLRGRHGYRNTHPEMAAVWLARGAAVPAQHVSERSLTEVAAFVAHLAGVTPPAHARPWPH